MSSSHPALRTALLVAFRHFYDSDVTDAEREQTLVAMVEHLDGDEAETAARLLHHLREAGALQMQMLNLLGQ